MGGGSLRNAAYIEGVQLSSPLVRPATIEVLYADRVLAQSFGARGPGWFGGTCQCGSFWSRLAHLLPAMSPTAISCRVEGSFRPVATASILPPWYSHSVIVECCLSCEHRGILLEHDLVRFGLNPFGIGALWENFRTFVVIHYRCQ